MPPLLALRDVRIRYGRRVAVDGLSLPLGAAGDPGCGKTSLPRFAAGSIEGSGELIVPARAGYIPQNLPASLSPFLTVGAAERNGAAACGDRGRSVAVRFARAGGLDAGGDSPEAVALSIVAEVQAVLAGRPGGELRWNLGAIHSPVEEIGQAAVAVCETVHG